MRPVSVEAVMLARREGSMLSIMGVAIGPGDILFTRMSGAEALASETVPGGRPSLGKLHHHATQRSLGHCVRDRSCVCAVFTGKRPD